MTEQQPRYLPTPEEIRRLCLQIQATWSDAERAKRACRGTAVVEMDIPQADRRSMAEAVRDSKRAG